MPLHAPQSRVIRPKSTTRSRTVSEDHHILLRFAFKQARDAVIAVVVADARILGHQ